jgi:hypothetical protein
MHWGAIAFWLIMVACFLLGYWIRGYTFNGRICQMRHSLQQITDELGRPVVVISHRPDCPVNLPPGPNYTMRLCNCDFGERLADHFNRAAGKPETGEYHDD